MHDDFAYILEYVNINDNMRQQEFQDNRRNIMWKMNMTRAVK